MAEGQGTGVAWALARLGADMQDGEAFLALDAYVRRRTRVLVDRAHWQEDIAQDVLLKLLERLDRGDLELHSGAAAYVSTAIRNTFTDYLRREHRQELIAERVEQAQVVRGAAEPPLGAVLDDPRDLLLRLAARARQQRQERYRADFDKDVEQVLALVFEGRSMTDIVCQAAGIPADSPGYRTAANSVYKRHSRLRLALGEAGDALAAAGALDDAELALLPHLLEALVYVQRSSRQQGGGSAVSGGETDPRGGLARTPEDSP